LLKARIKPVLETALEEEVAEHPGYDRHDPVGRNRGNSLNREARQNGVDRLW
jgi:putative transposase